jgi:DNA-binding XRE family transcriptional regulator
VTHLSFTLKAPKPSHNRTVEECHTLGDHIRKIRIDRNESQSCVAHLLGTTTDTITNWELGRNKPMAHHTPLILTYLGYTPLLAFAGTSLSKKLKQFMYVNGLTQKECAKKLEVDPQTIGRAVDGERVFNKTTRRIILSISTHF